MLSGTVPDKSFVLKSTISVDDIEFTFQDESMAMSAVTEAMWRQRMRLTETSGATNVFWYGPHKLVMLQLEMR